MAKYRKKPLEIEAFKWTGDINLMEDPIWIVEAIQKGDVWCRGDSENGYTVMIIANNGSVMTANRGDYIIKGIKGEIYPCKPEIFEMTYEAIEERKDCGSKNIERFNEVAIICDGKETILHTPLEMDFLFKNISEFIKDDKGFLFIRDHISGKDKYFNLRKITMIKYIATGIKVLEN